MIKGIAVPSKNIVPLRFEATRELDRVVTGSG